MIDELLSISYEDVMRKDIPNEPDKDGFPFVYEYADIFFNGACNIFALALHDEFGYEVYESTKYKCHYFCIYMGKFIDFRGICDRIQYPDSTKYIEEYKLVDLEPEREIIKNNTSFEKEGYEFALEFIRQNRDRYVL